jgi:hypothetical protein
MLTITLNDEAVQAKLDEPGIAHWAQKGEQSRDRFTEPGWTLRVDYYENDSDEHLTQTWIDATALARAVQIVADTYPQHLPGLLDPLAGDRTTGDALIQCACFGEVRYG